MVHSQLNTYTTQHKAREKGRDIFSFLLVCQVRGRMTSLEIFQDKAGSSEFILLALIYVCIQLTVELPLLRLLLQLMPGWTVKLKIFLKNGNARV